ncbi:hypothetical protein Tco_0820008 [Tanacetum coccineum]|uniref:Uncharacterized protein n=1 Tax=Tanacetum coccineum TaxID=301880 RepID=A0ABQ5ACW7_9ASTR
MSNQSALKNNALQMKRTSACLFLPLRSRHLYRFISAERRKGGGKESGAGVRCGSSGGAVGIVTLLTFVRITHPTTIPFLFSGVLLQLYMRSSLATFKSVYAWTQLTDMLHGLLGGGGGEVGRGPHSTKLNQLQLFLIPSAADAFQFNMILDCATPYPGVLHLRAIAERKTAEDRRVGHGKSQISTTRSLIHIRHLEMEVTLGASLNLMTLMRHLLLFEGLQWSVRTMLVVGLGVDKWFLRVSCGRRGRNKSINNRTQHTPLKKDDGESLQHYLALLCSLLKLKVWKSDMPFPLPTEYGYIKNHKKTVKNGQARTRESEEYKKKPKDQSRSQICQASVKDS